MPAHWITAQVILVLFLATLVRSSFGFGRSSDCGATARLRYADRSGRADSSACFDHSCTCRRDPGLAKGCTRAARDGWWFRRLRGIPLGLLLLKTLPEPIVAAILGAVVLAISLHSLTSRRNHELKDDRLAGIFGFAAGVLGGAYGMNGPPLAIYGSLRRWSPSIFAQPCKPIFFPQAWWVWAATGSAVCGPRP